MNATPLRILIVDDHVDNARMLKVLLKKTGHEAGIVLDGPSAIVAAKHQKPRNFFVPGQAATRLLSINSRRVCIANSGGWREISCGMRTRAAPFRLRRWCTRPISASSTLRMSTGRTARTS